MTDTRIRLVFAGMFTGIALVIAAMIMLTGVAKGLAVVDIIALATPFTGLAGLGGGYFFGQSQNGTGQKNRAL